MVENQRILCRLPYLDNDIFQPSKIQLFLVGYKVDGPQEWRSLNSTVLKFDDRGYAKLDGDCIKVNSSRAEVVLEFLVPSTFSLLDPGPSSFNFGI